MKKTFYLLYVCLIVSCGQEKQKPSVQTPEPYTMEILVKKKLKNPITPKQLAEMLDKKYIRSINDTLETELNIYQLRHSRYFSELVDHIVRVDVLADTLFYFAPSQDISMLRHSTSFGVDTQGQLYAFREYGKEPYVSTEKFLSYLKTIMHNDKDPKHIPHTYCPTVGRLQIDITMYHSRLTRDVNYVDQAFGADFSHEEDMKKIRKKYPEKLR